MYRGFRCKDIKYLHLNFTRCEKKMRQKSMLFISQTFKPGTQKFKMEVGLEEALDMAGVGKYQFFHCALMLASLASAVLEMIGNAFILPAAACDLDLPEGLRGIITSIPNIGVIITAPFWGRAADSLGRKPVLLYACSGAGTIGLLAALMPNLLTYALCKFLGSLFLACPSSLGFAYAGELVPLRRRDVAVLTCNGLLMLSTTFSPLLAWGILSNGWRYQLGTLTLRPWRLLTAVYAAPLILTAAWMTQAMESPKFLMAKGRQRQALAVLRHIHSKNSGLEPDSYCVTSLREVDVSGRNMPEGSDVELSAKARQDSPLALLRKPHLKWLALTGFLMFGVFSLLNGLFLFAPHTVNKVMQGSSHDEGTVCVVMNQADNQTSTGCDDSISYDTFFIMVVTTLIYGVVVLVASLCPISKKTLLVSTFSTTGVACLLSGTLTNRKVAGVMMSALQLTALGIGPLTAYAVHLFPTHLRGTAVGAVLMCGRIGSVLGANAAGLLLAAACNTTFYIFAALLFLCSGLSFLLPKEEQSPSNDGHSESSNTAPG